LTYAGRATRVRYVVLGFVCVLSFLTYFDRVCIVRTQKEIQRDTGITDQQMGFVLAAFWLTYALFDIPGGWLGDRFGSRRTLTRIVLAWSVFTAFSGAAVGFGTLLTCRLLFGVGEAGAYPNIARIQSRWFPPRTRARVGGIIWLVARWGAAFSGVIMGSLLRAFNTQGFRRSLAAMPILRALSTAPAWRLGFLLSGLIGLVWCALFYTWFRDDPAQKKSVNQAELDLIHPPDSPAPVAQSQVSMSAEMWRRLFTCPSLWAMGILYLCGSFGWSFFVSFMPRFFDEVHHVTFEKSEWMTVGPQFFAGLSCLAGGLCSDALVRATGWRRLGRALFPIAGCSTAAVAMIGLRFVHTPRQATVLLCIAAAAYDFGQGANWASIIDLGGMYAGAAAGLINTLGNMGNVIQPATGPWVISHMGWNQLLTFFAVAYLLSASMWLFINPKRTFYDRAGPEPEASAPDPGNSQGDATGR
jgi:MFS family permease